MQTIVLAFPATPTSDLTLDQMVPMWKEAELLCKEGVAREVGVADLDKDRLEELYNWASLKPRVDQVNVAHCCTIPEVSPLASPSLQPWPLVQAAPSPSPCHAIRPSSYSSFSFAINFFPSGLARVFKAA